MSLNINFPVFVFPTSLKFYLNTRSSHKQLLTLYNPCDFPVRFKVLSTAPNKYAVIDPEGSIGPKSCVDIVIRHTQPLALNCGTSDKFKITMQDHTTKQVLGQKIVESSLIQGERDNNSNDSGDNYQNVNFPDRTIIGDERANINANRALPHTYSINYFIAIVIGLVCSVILFMPTKQEPMEKTSIPEYLHVSVNLKLVLAYVLGLVSMVVFRP